jgi:hypothetical protein
LNRHDAETPRLETNDLHGVKFEAQSFDVLSI